MQSVDLATAQFFEIPMRVAFRGLRTREGVLVRGPIGWAEFCPFPEYDDLEALGWWRTTVEQATVGWPSPIRPQVAVNCIIPAVGPEQAGQIAADSGCTTAKVKVAGGPLDADLDRVAAVRAALGERAAIRVDANGGWTQTEAITAIAALHRAAGGLQYVEQPCATVPELAAVRRRVRVPIAADESIRRAADPLLVAQAEAADIAILKCTPLGGVRRALAIAEACGLPCVVSSALESSIGLAAQIALAAALPQLDYACGLATLDLLAGDLVSQPLRPQAGILKVPSQPPAPDPRLLAQYAIRDQARVRWWRDRLHRVAQLAATEPPKA